MTESYGEKVLILKFLLRCNSSTNEINTTRVIYKICQKYFGRQIQPTKLNSNLYRFEKFISKKFNKKFNKNMKRF